MPRFIEGQDRHQVTLLPEALDDFIAEDNAVRVVDAFVQGAAAQEGQHRGRHRHAPKVGIRCP